MIAETFVELIKDPNHWAFEIFTTIVQDVIILGVAWPFVKKAVRLHDERKHKKECDHE